MWRLLEMLMGLVWLFGAASPQLKFEVSGSRSWVSFRAVVLPGLWNLVSHNDCQLRDGFGQRAWPLTQRAESVGSHLAKSVAAESQVLAAAFFSRRCLQT
jgi:hypothetical protein